MYRGIIIIFIIFLAGLPGMSAAGRMYRVSGKVVDAKTSEPIAYASVRVLDMELWAVTDDDGQFRIDNIPEGRVTIQISILGYVTRTYPLDVTKDVVLSNIRLKEDNLSLPGIEVTAKRTSQAGATSYVMDRTALDHMQVLNLNDVMSLTPGSQTVNSSLMNDDRVALRAGAGEQGNAAFGTAIEIDGVRLDNNANMNETMSASTRNMSSADIESVEIVPGVPGVEYGDVSNGVVKVNRRKGRSPWILEASINPYSRQIGLSKGFALRNGGGVLNVSAEYAMSFSDIASPHTSYNRKIISLGYNRTFNLKGGSSLSLNAGVNGNLGGYSSKADPDAFADTYTRMRDNMIAANLQLDWQLNSATAGIFKAILRGAVLYSDQRNESYTNTSSASSQAYIHTMKSGYSIAEDYKPGAGVGDIILGPTGYWYVRQFNDQKPLSVQAKLKGDWTLTRSSIVNKVNLGVDFQSSSNKGKGVYYSDMSVAPTWRPYDYSMLPALNTVAVFLEDRLTWRRLLVNAGVRNDITLISGSEYGTVSTFSPRLNVQYDIFKTLRNSLTVHAGYGKGVKLPSFQVLYPADSYSDKLIFTPGSTADNKAYYAYFTNVSSALYNKDLKWQYAHQFDIGADLKIGGIKVSISGFLNNTRNPYQMINIYRPFTYNYTSQASLEDCVIPSSDRRYDVDAVTGVVTVTSVSTGESYRLPYSERHTYISNRQYINGSPITRYGLEWIVDAPITNNFSTVGLSLRLDGSYSHYKGINNILFAGSPSGTGDYAVESGMSPLIGYYLGSNVTSAGSAMTASVSNGVLSKGCSVNATLTARIPRIRLVMTLRLESTFLNYKRNLSEGRSAFLLAQAGDVTGVPYNGQKDGYVALYPEYYSTWENPDVKIPFAEKLLWAADNDPSLYRQLCDLIVRSNTSYFFNPQSISAYFSANFSVTKEIGDHVGISLYANNFFNNMSFVRNTQTGLDTSLFGSGYIPKFYYGVALRIKI